MSILKTAETFITGKKQRNKEIGDMISHIMSKNSSFVKMEEANASDSKLNVDYWLYWDDKVYGIYAKNNPLSDCIALPYTKGPLLDNEKENRCDMIAAIYDNTLYLTDRRKLLAYIEQEIMSNKGFLRNIDGISWVLIFKHIFIGISEFGYKRK